MLRKQGSSDWKQNQINYVILKKKKKSCNSKEKKKKKETNWVWNKLNLKG